MTSVEDRRVLGSETHLPEGLFVMGADEDRFHAELAMEKVFPGATTPLPGR